MNNNNYHKQVALLISVIPEIALEPRFALLWIGNILVIFLM